MKKKILNILIIVVSLIVIILLINYGLYLYLINKNNVNKTQVSALIRKNITPENMLNIKYKNPSGLNYKNKKSIVVFGCGYAEGVDLSDDQTFEKKLSDYLKVPVYNKGIGSGFIQHTILAVQSGQMDDIIKKSNIAIYILPTINDAVRLKVYPDRNYFNPMFLYAKNLYPVFEEKNGELVLRNSKFPSLTGNTLNRLLTKIYLQKKYFNDCNLLTEYTVQHFIKLNNELKAINPNIKLVIINFWDLEQNTRAFNKLMKNENISVIHIADISKSLNIDLTSDEYRTEQNKHPNEKTWNILTPLIAKELKKIK